MSKDMQDPMQANVEFSSNMFEPSKVMQDLFYLQSLSAMHNVHVATNVIRM